MKNKILYSIITLCITLLSTSCMDDRLESASGIGTLAINISSETRAGDIYNPEDYCKVRIYNSSDELIRKYNAKSEIPASLSLLAGTYTIKVQLGDLSDATTTNKSYKGEKEFTIVAGQTNNVEVKCSIMNVTAKADFDTTIATNFGDTFYAIVCINDTYDAAAISTKTVPFLKYTASGAGYFIMPEGKTTLSWYCVGTHTEKGKIEKTGTITNVKAGGVYNLKFAYSKPLGGTLSGITVTVDETTEDHNDEIVFSPDPTVKGQGFDIAEPQNYISGNKTFVINSMGVIKSASLTMGSNNYDLMGTTTGGVSVNKVNDYTLNVTLSDALFSGLDAGAHQLSFAVEDNDGGASTTKATIRTQGLVKMTSANYSLWTNSGTITAMVFDGAAVKIAIRKDGGAWSELPTTESNGVYTAQVAPTWTTATNAAGLTVYTVNSNTGLFAGHTYEYKLIKDNVDNTTLSLTTTTTQSIYQGNFEDSGMSCFGSSNSSALYWGSGNNSMASTLCTFSSLSGMVGSGCAKLTAKGGVMLVGIAPGNLFTGTFTMNGTKGTVAFGREFNWDARPTALRFKYHATVGAVTDNYHNGPLAEGTQDIQSIYIAIVDWSSTHNVVSGTSAPSGVWSPAKATSTSEGNIIGYGFFEINKTTSGSEMVEYSLPIQYYDKVTCPSKKYGIVISCATSMYGDYLDGCSSNVLYVDNFELVY